jgi:hypothetical protein
VTAPPAPHRAPILAAQTWRSNAELIETARDLGYIGARVLDPTYGRGTWWKNWRPDELVAHDIKLDGVDFRHLPDDGLFDTAVFDPPYIPQGGRETSTLAPVSPEHHDEFGRRRPDFLHRYGLLEVPSTNRELRELIDAGITELGRHVRRGGTLLVKCMGYVNGSQYKPMPRWVANHAETVGFVQIDELVHLRRPGPQPPRDIQRTARRNYSLLLVFRQTAQPTQEKLL